MEEEIEKAKEATFKLISYRMRSCKELEDRLKKKGFSQAVIDEVIQELSRMNYLNDIEFARAFVESRLLHNPKGKSFLKYELLQKGVDKQTAEEVVGEMMPPEEEEKFARLLAEKIWKKKKNLEEVKRKAQTYNYLARRGFPASLIKRIVEELSE
ncbi:MAG TPA: regulatory protein RecX [Candidatus Omnitrophica bacterium]|nr:regulatory protein RecX [Candidatus Omnitrophota bacterium]